MILKGTRRGTSCWSWNGDIEAPTLKPSILLTSTREITDEEADRITVGEKLEIPKVRCHSWVNNGRVQFLDDSSHELAGRELPLEDVDWF